MALTLEQYIHYLDKRGIPWPAPPAVERPKAKPFLQSLPGVRVVSWNVYGTLLAVSGGELCFEHPQRFVMDLALDKTLEEFKMWGSMTRKPGQPAKYLGQIYADVLTRLRIAPSVGGDKYPEIGSDKLWEEIIKKLLQKDYQFDAGFFGSLNEFSRKVAYFFHASLQGAVCYPKVAQTLRQVAESGRKQGLLANGQCFTIGQLQRGLAEQDPWARLEQLLDPEICILSYEQRVRKPSERPFRHLLSVLEKRGVGPGEVLHVGSRLGEDVAPARRLGMRTALFAGDKAPLDATPERLKDPGQRPDILITELDQLTEALG
jgi:FMN phosphatase YigB (HAD superfamily)